MRHAQGLRRGVVVAAALTVAAGGVLVAPALASAADSASAIPTVWSLGGAKVVDDASAYAAASTSPDWVRTPNGLMNKSCTTRLPAGASVVGHAIKSASGHVSALKSCAYPRLVKPGTSTKPSAASKTRSADGAVPTTNGWMAASWWSAPTWLSRLYSTFTVPAAPAVQGATDFFFPSFEPNAGNAIIQPVLSYGGSAAGGGDYWYITSWYVFDNQVVFGNNVTVNTGDLIEGTMGSSGCAGDGTNCNWTITTKDLTAGGQPTSVLNTQSPYSYTTAQGGVLESYGANCNQLPGGGSVHFGDLQFADSSGAAVGPSFGSWIPDGECGAGVSYSAGTTDITWNPNA